MTAAAGGNPSTVRVIGGFKLLKGLLLLAVGVGAFSLLGDDVGARIREWVAQLRVDPHDHLVHLVLTGASLVDERGLTAAAVGTSCYAGLTLTEGVGLLLGRRWGEYLTIVATGAFVPLEVWELVRQTTPTRVVVLIINVAIVVYLVLRVRRG